MQFIILKGETEMINLIVATHGKMSEETVNLTKMVLGESEQLDFVTFVPGEGPEDLIESFKNTGLLHFTIFLLFYYIITN